MGKLFSHKLSLVTQMTWASISCLVHRFKKKKNPHTVPASFLDLLGEAEQSHKTTENKVCRNSTFSVCVKVLLGVVEIVLVSHPRIPKSSEGERIIWDCERSLSGCRIRTGAEQVGQVVYGSAKPGHGEAGGVLLAPCKGDAKVACFPSSISPGQSLRTVPSMHIPEEQWLGTQSWGACVARGPVAWGCSCLDSFSPGVLLAF